MINFKHNIIFFILFAFLRTSDQFIQNHCKYANDENSSKYFKNIYLPRFFSENSLNDKNGATAKVKFADYFDEQTNKHRKVAIKQISIGKTQNNIFANPRKYSMEDTFFKFAKNEIFFLELFKKSGSKKMVEYFGCFYAVENNEMFIYILIEKLFSEMVRPDSFGPTAEIDYMNNFEDLPQSKKIRVFYDLALQLESISKLNLAHNDIKPENVMLSIDETSIPGEITAKFIDFGGVNNVNEQMRTFSEGYLDWDSYEQFLLMGRKLNGMLSSFENDIWAFALTIGMTLMKNKSVLKPYETYFYSDIYNKKESPHQKARSNILAFIKKNDWAMKFKQNSFYNLMEQMLIVQRNQRKISIHDIVIRLEKLIKNLKEEEEYCFGCKIFII